MTPHKHAAVIKAWADGATVQYKVHGDWRDCGAAPGWFKDEKYRVKPEPVPLWQVARQAFWDADDKAPEEQWWKDVIASILKELEARK